MLIHRLRAMSYLPVYMCINITLCTVLHTLSVFHEAVQSCRYIAKVTECYYIIITVMLYTFTGE